MPASLPAVALTPELFTLKWQERFAYNEWENIDDASFREFAQDIAQTFGAVPANVPAYDAGTEYPLGYLVRYVVPASNEAFFYSLKAGLLPAPVGAGDANWKLVPGPVAATALSQLLPLATARSIEGTADVKPGRLYQIDWGENASGVRQYVFVEGLAQYFAPRGTLVAGGQRTPIRAIDMPAGTFAEDTGSGALPEKVANFVASQASFSKTGDTLLTSGPFYIQVAGSLLFRAQDGSDVVEYNSAGVYWKKHQVGAQFYHGLVLEKGFGEERDGALEYGPDGLYFTLGAQRSKVALGAGGAIDYAHPVVRQDDHAYDDFSPADFGRLVVLAMKAQATPQVWEVSLVSGATYAKQLVHVVVAAGDNSTYRLTLGGNEVATITRATGILLQLDEAGTAYRILSGPDGVGAGGAGSFDQLTGNPRDNLRLAAALDAVASLNDGRRDLISVAGNRYNDLVLETRATLTGLKLGPNASAVQAQVLQGGNKAVSAPRTGSPADVLTAIQADINALSSFDFYLVRFQTTPAVSTDVAHVLLTVS